VNGSRVFTSDAFLDLDTPCAHLKTHNSVVGDVWTVSTGLPMNSIPFGGLRYNGLFLKKQFYDVLADPSPTDMLFAPSFNEFAANAHPMSGWDMTNPLFYASGASGDDPDRFVIVFDDFTSERSRTIEPSKQDGGRYLETFASCMRVYRLQLALGLVSDGASCDVAGEECCEVSADESFAVVASLESDGGSFAVLTNDAAEAAALRREGYRELCAPVIDNVVTTTVCWNESLPWSGGPDVGAVRGPFVLLANGSGASVAGTAPLVRCAVDAPLRRFVDNSTACAGGRGRAELVLGFGGAARGGLFSREVRRCAATSGGPLPRWYSVSGGACAEGDYDEGVVGYAI